MLPFQWAWCLLANSINYIKLPRFHTANQQIPQEQNQGFIHGIYMAENGSPQKVDGTPGRRCCSTWADLKEVTFSIERLNAEVSPIRWSRWAPDTQWLWVVKGPNGWYHDEEFDDEGEEDAEMIQSPWNILHIIFPNIFLFFLVKMFHFIFLACWTWLQSTCHWFLLKTCQARVGCSLRSWVFGTFDSGAGLRVLKFGVLKCGLCLFVMVPKLFLQRWLALHKAILLIQEEGRLVAQLNTDFNTARL